MFLKEKKIHIFQTNLEDSKTSRARTPLTDMGNEKRLFQRYRSASDRSRFRNQIPEGLFGPLSTVLSWPSYRECHLNGERFSMSSLCFKYSQSIKVVLKLCANSDSVHRRFTGFTYPHLLLFAQGKIALVLPSSKSWQSQSWFGHFSIHSFIRFCLS